MEFLTLVENADNELRDEWQAGARAVPARVQAGGRSAGLRSGQAIAVVAKVLGIPKASLGNWVGLSAKGELDGAGGGDKSIQVSPEQMEIARLRAENARLRMECDIAKKAAAYFVQDTLRGTPGTATTTPWPRPARLPARSRAVARGSRHRAAILEAAYQSVNPGRPVSRSMKNF